MTYLGFIYYHFFEYHSDKRFIAFNCLEHGLLSGQATVSKNLKESVDDFEFNHFYTTN